MAKRNTRWAGNAAPELIDTSMGAAASFRCEASRPSMLAVFFGLQRLAILVSSGANGFMLYRQTPEGLRLLGAYHATIPAALAALLREVR